MKNTYPVIRSSRTVSPALPREVTVQQGLNTVFKFLEGLLPKLSGKSRNIKIDVFMKKEVALSKY